MNDAVAVLAGASIIAVLIALVIGLAATIFWIWSLIDLLRIPEDQWQAAHQNKILWLAIVIVLGALGSLLYYFIPRPTLITKFHTPNSATFDSTQFGVPSGGVTRTADGFRPHDPS